MLKRFLLLLLPVLLLICLYQLKPQTSDVYRMGAFHLPALFTPSQLTQDTTNLPDVKFIQTEPSLRPEVEAYLVKGIQHLYNKFYIIQFGYAFPKDITITIRIFPEIEVYRAYTSRITSVSTTSHIGVYLHSIQEIAVWQGPHTARFIKTVFHETSHFLLKNQAPLCPRWLNEGLSEYFEEIDLTGELPVVYAQVRKDRWVKKSLLAAKIPALKDYLTQTNQQWTRMDNTSGAYRTIAWPLVYYLMSSRNGQQTIKHLLYFYRNQHLGPQSLHLLNTLAELNSFGQPHPETAIAFEKNWRKWAKGERKKQQIILQPLEQNYLTDIHKWLAVQWEE